MPRFNLPSGIREWLATPLGRRGIPRGGEQGTAPGDDQAGVWGEATDRETNDELAGRARYRVYDQMALSDPVVAGSLAGVEELILAEEARVEPVGGGADPVDRLVAEAAACLLGMNGVDPWLERGFAGFVRWGLLGLRYGSMTGEVVWDERPTTWIPEDGRGLELYVIRKVAPRFPSSIVEYKPGPGGAYPLASIRQWTVNREVDGRRLVHIVNGEHIAPFVGTSIIRPAYGPWRLKSQMMVDAAIGYSRHAYGTPVMRHPAGEENQRIASEIVSAHRSHERQGITLAGPPPTQENPHGWDFRIESGAQSLADPIPLLRHFDEQIVSATLQRFLMLGSTDTGSRAVGEVLAEPFYRSLNRYAELIAGVARDQLLRRWVDVNFGPEVDVPRITFGGIQQKNLETMGRFLYEAANAGVDFTDVVAQNIIRAALDIPPHEPDYVPLTQREGTSPVL